MGLVQTVQRTSRQEILEAARALFVRCGYGNVSVSAILQTAGLSKGTFYHYFTSKEQLLDAVIARDLDAAFTYWTHVWRDPRRSALDKLNDLPPISLDVQMLQARTLHEDSDRARAVQDPALRERLNEQVVRRAVPYLTSVLEQGMREGVFDLDDSAGTAEIMLRVCHAVAGQNSCSLQQAAAVGADSSSGANHRVELLARTVERILGAASGSLTWGQVSASPMARPKPSSRQP